MVGIGVACRLNRSTRYASNKIDIPNIYATIEFVPHRYHFKVLKSLMLYLVDEVGLNAASAASCSRRIPLQTAEITGPWIKEGPFRSR